MADKTMLVHGIDGTAYAVKLVDTSTTDAQGREIYTVGVDAVIEVGDLEIGAVEIKDATGATRATVGSNGLYVDVRNIAGGTALLGKVGIDQSTANANEVVLKAGTAVVGATMDAGLAQTTVFGLSGAAVLSADMTTAAHVTDSPTTGQKLVIVDVIVSVDTAMSVLFEDHTGADLFKVYMPANSTLQITPRGKLKLAVANDVMTAKASVSGNIAVTAFYYSEA